MERDTGTGRGPVALVGATGAVGRSVAAALARGGRPYRAIGRTRSSLEEAFGPDPLAELATGDQGPGVGAQMTSEGRSPS